MDIAIEVKDQATEQSIDWYSEIEETSENVDLRPNQVEMLHRQTSYLASYVKYGNVQEACEDARVTRPTVQRWRGNDSLGFRGKLADAHEAYIDRIEGRMRALAEEGRSYQAIKAILDAGRPAVWRDRSTLDTGTADLLSKLAAQATPPARKAGEQYMVDSPIL